MKLFLLAIICIVGITALGQTTNFFWSANKTSNEIHSAISSRMGTNSIYQSNSIIAATTNMPPIKTLFFGITTNVQVVMPNATNYFWFTNGILTLITNSPT